jgi:hypothetical protein
MNVMLVDGEVVVLGPDGVAVALTPAAAEESARRLSQCARDAAARTTTQSRDEIA